MKVESFPVYYREYISKIPEGEPLELLKLGIKETLATLVMVSEEKANDSYAVGKWSIKDIVQHLIDTERIYTYRALAFARGEQASIMGYDHDQYAKSAQANQRTLKSLLEEFKQLRASTVSLVESFSEEMLEKKGNANGFDMSVKQIQFILIGHELHHMWVIQQKYLT